MVSPLSFTTMLITRGVKPRTWPMKLAHGLLCHPMTSLTDESGARVFNRQHEDEANWLGPALLISEEAALHIAELRLAHAVARELYQVSNEVLQMRLRVTGALLRIARRPAA